MQKPAGAQAPTRKALRNTDTGYGMHPTDRDTDTEYGYGIRNGTHIQTPRCIMQVPDTACKMSPTSTNCMIFLASVQTFDTDTERGKKIQNAYRIVQEWCLLEPVRAFALPTRPSQA